MELKKKILHQISLSNIGGVQRSFKFYFLYALKKSVFQHYVYGMHKLNVNFFDLKDFYKNIQYSIINKIKFVFFLFSKNYIIHFYNNLGSHQINSLLKIIPYSNIIFHERGLAWNAKDKDIKIYQDNASRAKVIIANSNAAKIILTKRFGIDKNKIKVIYNGFLNKDYNFVPNNYHRYSKKFSIGYIGRLDTPKGVHVLINAAKDLQDYDFFIAGEGILEDELKKLSLNYRNINFVGKINEPLNFISKMDIIVVPSIREPLGNVIIKSGYCKKAVIASNIDGIAEIIKNGENGILIHPEKPLSFNKFIKDAVPLPKFVVNPETTDLQVPQEIDKDKLKSQIVILEKNPTLRKKYGEKLSKTVKEKFNIESYFKKLEIIYRDIK